MREHDPGSPSPDPSEARAPIGESDPGATPATALEPAPPRPGEPAAAPAPRVAGALAAWLGVFVVFGVGGLAVGAQELSALVALSGLFVAAQAADADPRWRPLHYLVGWVVPAGGAIAFGSLGVLILDGESGPARAVGAGLAFAGAAVALLSVFRPFANGLAAGLFRAPVPSHTLRLAARLVALTLMMAVPGWLAFRQLFDRMLQEMAALLERMALGGELVGYVLLALASVGFMVRRDLRGTMDRLGLRPLARSHLVVVVVGVAALLGLNAGAEWLQRSLFPALWESDREMTEMIARGLGPGRILLLGLSAGVGEEVTLRGALQPKLGLLLTSALFAVLHVQYSWFGIAVIFLMSVILGAIRNRTSTTVVVGIHVLYDVVALFAA